ncbi:Serine/threonine-protein kinase AGC1-5 (AGC serine/threonine-protein kinase subfamily 1 member 5) [Durusdinium trenchii]|uniref:Serine/threonine-protein kinase AGC1-5 (AGC serine/threonine-protein kinase subfamily 1 member 5) n=1 Tax=Durusdinium trenchii TaxID=1381693 RepID=A0ABP0MKK1_9DINO
MGLERMCRKVVWWFRKRTKWGGPSCTCDEFRRMGQCKHLLPFKDVDVASYAGATLDPSDSIWQHRGTGTQGSTFGNYTFASSTTRSESKASVRTSVKKAKAAQGDGDKVDLPPLAVTKLAISNTQGPTGDVVVPFNIKLFSSKLELLDNIGRGGCGRVVYRAASEPHGIVLVKVLRVQAPTCLPHHNEILNSELEILADMNHPNLIPFLGYQEVMYEHDVLERRVVFEFGVDTLGDLVKHRATAHDRLSYIEVRKYGIDVAEALQYIHKAGIAHRDLSAENIFMMRTAYPASGNWTSVMKKHFRLSRSFGNIFGTGGGAKESQRDKVSLSGVPKPGSTKLKASIPGWRAKPGYAKSWTTVDQNFKVSGPNFMAKVGNFEVAKRVFVDGKHLRTRTRVTSPQYMAPEMFKAEEHDTSVDIWALGAILYEMLAKEKPFARHYNLDQIEQIVCSKQFPPKGSIAPSEFKALEKVMHYCLHFDALARPSASHIAGELKRLL